MRNPYVKLQDNISIQNIIVAKFQGTNILKKGNNSKKISYDFFQFFIKHSIHHPLSADTSFKFLALILFEIWHLQILYLCLSKGRNFTRGENSGQTKNKKLRQLFLYEESIHKVLRRYLNAPYIRTDKPKPICPHVFKVGGIKTYESRYNELLQRMHYTASK